MGNMIEQIYDLMKQLSPDKQQRVLEYAQNLAQTDRVATSLPKTSPPPGTSGRALLAALQNSKLSPEDVDAMERALEDCEKSEL